MLYYGLTDVPELGEEVEVFDSREERDLWVDEDPSVGLRGGERVHPWEAGPREALDEEGAKEYLVYDDYGDYEDAESYEEGGAYDEYGGLIIRPYLVRFHDGRRANPREKWDFDEFPAWLQEALSRWYYEVDYHKSGTTMFLWNYYY